MSFLKTTVCLALLNHFNGKGILLQITYSSVGII